MGCNAEDGSAITKMIDAAAIGDNYLLEVASPGVNDAFRVERTNLHWTKVGRQRLLTSPRRTRTRHDLRALHRFRILLYFRSRGLSSRERSTCELDWSERDAGLVTALPVQGTRPRRNCILFCEIFI
jgi:hypothetical protein